MQTALCQIFCRDLGCLSGTLQVRSSTPLFRQTTALFCKDAQKLFSTFLHEHYVKFKTFPKSTNARHYVTGIQKQKY